MHISVVTNSHPHESGLVCMNYSASHTMCVTIPHRLTRARTRALCEPGEKLVLFKMIHMFPLNIVSQNSRTPSRTKASLTLPQKRPTPLHPHIPPYPGAPQHSSTYILHVESGCTAHTQKRDTSVSRKCPDKMRYYIFMMTYSDACVIRTYHFSSSRARARRCRLCVCVTRDTSHRHGSGGDKVICCCQKLPSHAIHTCVAPSSPQPVITVIPQLTHAPKRVCV